MAQVPKQKYLAADACFKTLRNSPVKRQKVSEWLGCIHRYEAIYKTDPESSWAPAGMYKAAELYLQLFSLSKDEIYKTRAIDLLVRIRNKYPESAYNARAKTQLTSLSESPDPQTHPPKHIRSKKAETKKEALDIAVTADKNTNQDADFDRITTTRESDLQKMNGFTEADVPADTPEGGYPADQKMSGTDAHITDLRFWSNPEYTRIVINATRDRTYSHHLLKKDPDLNIPFQRLYVDIPQSRLGKEVAEHTPINDDLLKQARAGQYLPHTVRVVVDIKSFENYKIFSLKDPFRIVIDVWGTGNGTGDHLTAQKAAAKTEDVLKTSPMTTDNLKSSDIARQLALGVQKIVIDPGHGGPDPGAPGYIKGVWEKDIVLQMAKTLAAKLRDRLKCTVTLTRSTDTKLTLEERTAIANTQRADLFISLHTNAARNKNLAGIETYLLNLATDEQAIAVAARENATSRKNISDLEFILSDLMKHAKIGESTRLANDVHKALIQGMTKKYTGIKDLGVKQAPFYVLLGARMPSILIETSFISNKQECKRLLTPSYQENICNAIADGVQKYVDATNPRQL
ncbi:MAG: N-acetylmuramoyl-L-alanine amidase [Desulfotignum sp.]|nr:N-acetylmuramoyl-L-alanine amidase [Desulfotignum sp.]